MSYGSVGGGYEAVTPQIIYVPEGTWSMLLNQCFIKLQQLLGQFLFRLFLFVEEDMLAAEAKEVTVVVKAPGSPAHQFALTFFSTCSCFIIFQSSPIAQILFH